MPRKRHKPEEVVAKLRQVDELPPFSTGQLGVTMEGPSLCLGTCSCRGGGPRRVEVITGVAGRRYWPAHEKLRIVEGEEEQGSVRWTETPTNGAGGVGLRGRQ